VNKKPRPPGTAVKKPKRFLRKEVQEKEGRDYVLFMLGGEMYAAETLYIQEILKPGSITHIPNTPDFLVGVANLRGKILPVADLRRKFRMTEAGVTKASRVIVVKLGEEAVGALVDEVISVKSIPDETVETAPPEMLASMPDPSAVRGIANLEGQAVIVLDLVRGVQRAASADAARKEMSVARKS